MSSEFDTQIGPDIEVFDKGDAKGLGAHYAALHDHQTGFAYKRLGHEVKTGYEVTENPDGGAVVKIIESHK